MKGLDGKFSQNDIKMELIRFWNSIYPERPWLHSCPRVDFPHLYSISENNSVQNARENLTKNITMDELLRAVKHVKSNTSTGLTDIVPEWIKCLSGLVLVEILSLFRYWRDNGLLPDEAQVATVFLLHKAGKKGLCRKLKNVEFRLQYNVSCTLEFYTIGC